VSVAAVCPECGAVLEADAINASTDVAHCKACNTVHKLSEVVGQPELERALLDGMPRGAYERETLDGWVIGSTVRSGFLSAFLLVFAIGWNASFVASIGWAIVQGRLGSALFLVMPLAMGLLVGVVAVFANAGTQEVRMASGVGEVFTGVGSIGWKRTFDPATVRGVRLTKSNTTVNDRVVDQIEIEADPGIGFGVLLTEARKRWVGAKVRERLIGGPRAM
jgi:hypothetical protein